VVDDEEDARELIGRALEDKGAQITLAANSHEAIRILESDDIDVLLADIAMPGEDGYSLIKRIRETAAPATAAIPAAALTSFARDEDRQQALRAGFQLHLSKPVDPRSLVEAVANLGRISRSLVTSSS
jgi:CheY-like chemotaxis protein